MGFPTVQFPREYDEAIRLAANSYLPDWDWRYLKSQLYQESQLKPDAVSSSGADGIAQFMPGTWSDTRERMGFPAHASPFDPHFAIPACAWYMDTLRRTWKSPRPPQDLRRLTWASYDAGFGHLLEAQRLAGGEIGFTGIMAYLPAVTGHDNAMQTRTYVDRIEQWYALMVAGA